MDTIFALSSGRGKAGVAVIRVSGPDAHKSAKALCGSLPLPRRTSLRTLRDRNGDILDRGVLILFEKPASYTGEDAVELHIHGGTATVRAVLAALGRMANLRTAEPGEFTLRALQNGRIGIDRVEGLADLIDAETDAQRKQALRLYGGALGRMTESWRHDLASAAGLIEAAIDFADEEVPAATQAEAAGILDQLSQNFDAEIDGSVAAERIREGFEIAIIGPPNVGKSTLLNHLAGREAAITSATAGTTRDVIEVRMDIGGFPAVLLDMAGISETATGIEAIGVHKAIERAEAADLRIALCPDGVWNDSAIRLRAGDLVLRCKADLDSGPGISGRTGKGVSGMLGHIGRMLEKSAVAAGSATRERHVAALRSAQAELDIARNLLRSGGGCDEFAAEHVRQASAALSGIVGSISNEDVLGEIFSRFCIGK